MAGRSMSQLDVNGIPILPGQGAQPGGNDLMGNIRAVIDSIKEVIIQYRGTLELEREVRGGRKNDPAGKDIIEMKEVKTVQADLPPKVPPPPPPPPPAEPESLSIVKGILDSLIAQGNGDKTMGEVITMISPFTIKQARDYLDGLELTK